MSTTFQKLYKRLLPVDDSFIFGSQPWTSDPDMELLKVIINELTGEQQLKIQ